MKKMTNCGLKLMVVHSALVCSGVFAQTDAGTILQQQNRQELRSAERIPELPKTEVSKAPAALSGPRITVKTLKFTGPEALVSTPEMQNLAARWVGQEVDFAGLDRLAKQVTDLLRSRQWFLAQAYLPQQDVTEGHIEIAIQPGYLDGANGQGGPFSVVMDSLKPIRVTKTQIGELASRTLKPGALANEANLERTLLLVGDLPGVKARAQLEPGVNTGATRIILNVEEGPMWAGSIIGDNYGSRFTGNAQINAGLQINDPRGFGDQYSLNVTHTEGLDLARLGYSFPIASNGLRLSASWSPMNYKIVQGVGVDAGLKGSSATTALSLMYPIQRSRVQNVYASLGLNHKALKDDSNSGLLKDKRAKTLNASLSADQLDNFAGGGLSNITLGLTAGQIDLSRLTTDKESDATGYNTQGHFQKINYSVNRLQKLGGQFTLLANLYGQVAGKNLDSSEKFGLGGPSGVRAYVGGEATGDTGWVANLEVRYDWQSLSSDAGQVQLLAFYDAGRIRLHQQETALPITTATGRNRYGLAGWGLGANLSKSGSHALRVIWAQKSGSNPGRTTEGLDSDGRASTSRLWVQGTWWY
jgi:hemolysin activation/secretion protein